MKTEDIAGCEYYTLDPYLYSQEATSGNVFFDLLYSKKSDESEKARCQPRTSPDANLEWLLTPCTHIF